MYVHVDFDRMNIKSLIGTSIFIWFSYSVSTQNSLRIFCELTYYFLCFSLFAMKDEYDPLHSYRDDWFFRILTTQRLQICSNAIRTYIRVSTSLWKKWFPKANDKNESRNARLNLKNLFTFSVVLRLHIWHKKRVQGTKKMKIQLSEDKWCLH